MLAFSRIPTLVIVSVVLVSLLYAQSTNAQTAPAAAGAAYTVTDLGVLPGDVGSDAREVNEAGQVAGNSDNYPSYDASASASASASAAPASPTDPAASSASAPDASPSAASASASAHANHSFIWRDDGDPDTADMKDLGSLGADGAFTTGINDHGQVVGGSRDANGDGKPFLWENGSMRSLGTPEGYRHALAEDINNSGQAVGVAYEYSYNYETETYEESERAYMWHDGTKTDLGTLAGAPLSYAQAINASGQVAGYARDPQIREVNYRPFVWENGSMTALPTLEGSIGSPARDINDQGTVVGTAYYPRNADGDAPSKAWSYKDGNVTELPALPGYVSGANQMEPTAINSSGQIVGFAEKLPGYTDTTSWLYSDGQVHDIKDLIPAGSGWTDVWVNDINDKGQIVGSGKNANGERRAILLTPNAPAAVNSASAEVAAGGTLSTGGDGPTPATSSDPVNTTITTPVKGTVSIEEATSVDPNLQPVGFSFFGQQVTIEAPLATVRDPLSLTFVMDSTLLAEAGVDYTSLQLFRDGVRIGECDAGSSSTAASPDPCVKQRIELADGDAQITILSSHASEWNFGVAKAGTPLYSFKGFFGPVNSRPTVNVAKAGSAIPVKFSLGGDKGLEVFTAGYPQSGKIPTDPNAPLDGIEQTLTAGSSGLTYDAKSGQYTYTWKTSKDWAGQSRQLVLNLKDGTEHEASFKFTK